MACLRSFLDVENPLIFRRKVSPLLEQARSKSLECITCRSIFGLKKLTKETRGAYIEDTMKDTEQFSAHQALVTLWENVKNDKPTSPVRLKDMGLGKKVCSGTRVSFHIQAPKRYLWEEWLCRQEKMPYDAGWRPRSSTRGPTGPSEASS